MHIKNIFMIFLFSLFINCLGYYSTSPHLAVFVDTGQHIKHNTGLRTIGNAKVQKRGEDCISSFSLVNTFVYIRNNNSIQKAMQNAQITKIAVVDHYSTQIYPFGYTIYAKDCVVVWGE
jgi:hypothetical protein